MCALLPRSLLLKPLRTALNTGLATCCSGPGSLTEHFPCKKKPPPSSQHPKRMRLAPPPPSPCAYPSPLALKGFFSPLAVPDSAFSWFFPLRGDSDLGPAACEMLRWPRQRVGQGLGHRQKHQPAKSPPTKNKSQTRRGTWQHRLSMGMGVQEALKSFTRSWMFF